MVKIGPFNSVSRLCKMSEEVKKSCTMEELTLSIDVMDGHYVPNITIGPMVVRAIRGYTDLPFDVHLMMDNPLDLTLHTSRSQQYNCSCRCCPTCIEHCII